MVWDAFVSYSHAADGSLAPAVQQGLQRFMRPWHRRRALRVFRDDTGLTVDPALWDSIVRALDQSRFFILFASPESARSRWVNREIEHCRTTKPNKHILPVVTDGGWFWDENETDFDWNRSTAVPPALKGCASSVFIRYSLALRTRLSSLGLAASAGEGSGTSVGKLLCSRLCSGQAASLHSWRR
jgi:hypothetical protein